MEEADVAADGGGRAEEDVDHEGGVGAEIVAGWRTEEAQRRSAKARGGAKEVGEGGAEGRGGVEAGWRAGKAALIFFGLGSKRWEKIK